MSSNKSYMVSLQPGGEQFSAGHDDTLLAAALDQGIPLPYGCRNGACGACKGKVIAGQVDLGSFQPSTLTEEDRARGMALLCTAKACSDLTLEIRTVDATQPARTLPCRIERMEKLAPDVMALWLKLPANERLAFRPGQYLDFMFKDGKRRSFSIASTPDEVLIELHIRHVPGGWFTDQVFSTMKTKDIMRIHGPLGSFWLHESDKPALFLAGGTGFAPIKAILGHAIAQGIERQMILYWGARTRADLYQAEVPSAWQSTHANVRFIPVLSAPTIEEAWPGRTGFVHAAILQDFPDLSGVEVYACGSPPMIEAAQQSFRTHGLPEDAFYADSFNFQ